LLGTGFGVVAVDAWGGGHIKTFGAVQVDVVMHSDKCALGLVAQGGTGGAMGFVADDESAGQSVGVEQSVQCGHGGCEVRSAGQGGIYTGTSKISSFNLEKEVGHA
jgi:hypothetical protein